MRISDWSSDVCSSDLPGAGSHQDSFAAGEHQRYHPFDRGELHGLYSPRCRSDHCRTVAPFAIGRAAAGRLYGMLCRRGRITIRTPPCPLRSPSSEEHTPELQSLMRTPYAVSYLQKKNCTY